MTNEKQLEILHDHYKETFARLREAEASRDRLFLWIIGLFAVLSLEIGYPMEIGGSLEKVGIAGGEFNLQSLPLPVLLNVTWVLTLAISLRYCQTSVLVIRQYPYLHTLEEAISSQVGGGNLYRREGRVYLSEYPLLLDVTWFAYTILFPLILICATVSLIVWELRQLPYPFPHILFDIFVAGVLISFFFLYRVQPFIASKWKAGKTHEK